MLMFFPSKRFHKALSLAANKKVQINHVFVAVLAGFETYFTCPSSDME